MDNRKALKQGDKVIVSDHCFSIQKEIGRGTSSIVYTAIDEKNQQKVILKELYPLKLVDVGRDDNNIIQVKDNQVFNFYQKRLSDALELQSKMHDDTQTNLTTSFCYFTDNIEFPYYCAMEWRIGSTLSYEIAFPEFLEVCWQLSEILQLYHKKGYLHLDIKPSNVFWDGQRISLFDFDSVFKTDEIQSGFVSYSPHYAAPEVRKFPERIDKNKTDIYAIGIMLFRRIFNRYPEDKETWAYFPYDYSRCKDKLSPELKEIINDIFHHTLISYIDGRFTAEELSERLKKAVKVSEKKYYINSYELRPATNSDIAVKRTAELEQIKHFFLNGKKAVFLYGMGGTGKSELALQFAEKYSKQYAVTQKVGYFESLEKTIESIKISSDSARFVKNQYEDVKKLLSEISVDTLIIIDNYTFCEKDIEILTELVRIDNRHLNFIFTTRENQEQKLNLSNYIAFQNAEQLHTLRNDIAKMFFDITGEAFKSEYYQWAESFMENIQYHIMTIYILACQIKELDREFYHDYISLLDENGLSSDELNEDDNEMAVYRHIKTIFDMSSIKKSENELTVMINASLLPVDGMKEDEFIKLIGLKKGKFSTSPCQSLVMKSWLKREKRNGSSYISMHPLVAEICMKDIESIKYIDKSYVLVNNIRSTIFDFSNNICWLTFRKTNFDSYKVYIACSIAYKLIKMLTGSNIKWVQCKKLITWVLPFFEYMFYDSAKPIECCLNLMKMDGLSSDEHFYIEINLFIFAKDLLNDGPNPFIKSKDLYERVKNYFNEKKPYSLDILCEKFDKGIITQSIILKYCNRFRSWHTADDENSILELSDYYANVAYYFIKANPVICDEIIHEYFDTVLLLFSNNELYKSYEIAFLIFEYIDIHDLNVNYTVFFDEINSILFFLDFEDILKDNIDKLTYYLKINLLFLEFYRTISSKKLKNNNSSIVSPILFSMENFWEEIQEYTINKHRTDWMNRVLEELLKIVGRLGMLNKDVYSDVYYDSFKIVDFSNKTNIWNIEAIEDLFYCLESLYFQNQDYERSVEYLSPFMPHCSGNICQKEYIANAYKICSRYYGQMGNYERKEIYRIRANIVEEDYNNRKDSLGVSYHFQVKIDKAKSEYFVRKYKESESYWDNRLKEWLESL